MLLVRHCEAYHLSAMPSHKHSCAEHKESATHKRESYAAHCRGEGAIRKWGKQQHECCAVGTPANPIELFLGERWAQDREAKHAGTYQTRAHGRVQASFRYI